MSIPRFSDAQMVMMFSHALLLENWNTREKKTYVLCKHSDPIVASKLRSMHVCMNRLGVQQWQIERRTFFAFIAFQHLSLSVSWLCFLHEWHNIIAILSTIHGAAGRLVYKSHKMTGGHSAQSHGGIIRDHKAAARARPFQDLYCFVSFFTLLLGVVAPFCESERYKSSGTYGYTSECSYLFAVAFFFSYFILNKSWSIFVW